MECLSNIDVSDYSDMGESTNEAQMQRTPIEKKRKGSPLKSVTIKKHNSLPDISQASMPSTVKAKPKPKSFADMVIMSFNDAEFVNSVAPKICTMIQPLIQETIAASVTAAVQSVRSTVLEEILNSNSQLQQTVDGQLKLIQNQKSVIESQKQEIDSNKRRIDELEGENQFLSAEIDTLNSDVENLKIEVIRLEQYGRRSSLRFNNMNVDPNLNEIQLTTYMKNFINSNILKGPDAGELTESDIDRCHPVGGFRGKRKPQVIVKFFSYKVKARVYGNKSNLKNHPDKTFITEDLTKANHSTVKTLLKLKKNNKIDSFWTIDGKVLVKTSPTSKPLIISSADAAAKKFSTQLEEINDDEEYADAIGDTGTFSL